MVNPSFPVPLFLTYSCKRILRVLVFRLYESRQVSCLGLYLKLSGKMKSGGFLEAESHGE